MKKILNVLTILLLASLAFIGCSGADSKTTNDNNSQNQIETKSTEGVITLDQYNQISEGMTYEEIKAIIGSEGTAGTEIGKEGDAVHSISYNWTGSEVASFATLTFTNNELQLKFQTGLK